jgi:putative ABC transport system ATP-binding protein
MIAITDLDKYISSKFQRQFILKGLNLQIEEGEFVTIMGPSGAGKSTLLNIIGLLDDLSAGSYHLKDEKIESLSEKRKSALHKQHFGFVFQAYHLIDELTVYENIETPLLYRGVKSSERKSLVAEMLDKFGIVAKKDLFPAQLSGGQQQVVGVARAIIGKPSILLADEPTGNLHSTQSKEIMTLFQELNRQGTTIIQVTHSEENAQYGSRIIELEDGAIIKDISLKNELHVS